MRRTELRRLLKGSVKRALDEVVGALGTAARVEDLDGRVLVGSADAEGPAYAVQIDGEVVGSAVGQGAEPLARVVEALVAVELEKRGLAQETLGRYKELTLLYDMSEQFSKLLEPEAVALHAVEQAQRHLRASGARMLVHDPASDALHALASVGSAPQSEAGADVATRVFRSGHAELVGQGDEQVVCAPLRHGESLLGVLQVHASSGPVLTWSAGDLKLVCAMAANAASGLHRARLHAEQVRAMTLRHQMQRHTSPDLLEAVFDGLPPAGDVQVAVLFSDLRAASGGGTDEAPSALLERIDAVLTASLAVLMQHGAVVDVPLGEMLVAVFWDPRGFEHAARSAVTSAAALRSTGLGAPLAIGVAAGLLGDDRTESLDRTINAAARLHGEASGAVLVDAGVQAAVPERTLARPSSPPDLPVYEVMA